MYKFILAILLLLMNLGDILQNSLLRMLPSIIFIIVIIEEYLLNKQRIKFLKKPYILIYLFFFLVIIALIRTNNYDYSIQFTTFRLITFFTFFISFFSLVYNLSKKIELIEIFVNVFYIPSIVLLIINLLLYFIGFSDKGVEIGSSVILSYFGLIVDRVKFFLANGINAYGAVAGALFNLSLIGISYSKKYKKLFFTGSLVSIISLLLTDSRGPLIYSILIFILVTFVLNKSTKPKLLWLIPFIGFIGPILMLSFLSLISDSQLGDLLSRGSEDLTTGNSRLVIWTIAFSEFLVFKPEYHIFGYGEYGHYAAGLSQLYGSLVFGDVDNSNLIHPHNTFLSIALDYGYFGLLIFLILQLYVISIVKKCWNYYKLMSKIILANLLYFNFVGIGETMFGFYYQNVIYLFFIINIFAFIMQFNYNLKKKYV